LLRWLLPLALLTPCLAAAPAAIPVPDYMGVYIQRGDGTLTETPPVDETMRDLLAGADRGHFPPGFIDRLQSAVLAPDSAVVVYEPGLRIQDFVFLRLSPMGDQTVTLHPRVRPSREAEGLWEITWRDPLAPGVLFIAADSESTHLAHLAQITASGQPEAWPLPPPLIPMPASREGQVSPGPASGEASR
jgi:hypothetical protein